MITYRVLSDVSIGYPRLKDRLPTCYSPVRHGIATIRLACIRHAASVNPEPGSNSPKKFIFVCFNLFCSFFLKRIACFNSTRLSSSYTVFKDSICLLKNKKPRSLYHLKNPLSTTILPFLFIKITTSI